MIDTTAVIFERAGSNSEVPMRYAVAIEHARNDYSAYVPDLPGYVAVGDPRAAVDVYIREAIAFHIEGSREDGLPIPLPSSHVEHVVTAA